MVLNLRRKLSLVTREMTGLLVLDLMEKKLVTNQLVLTIGYDIENLKDKERAKQYKGEVTTDRYGRKIPKHAYGTANLDSYTSSSKLIMKAATDLFDRIVDKNLLVCRINVTVNRVINEKDIPENTGGEQLTLFTDYDALEKRREKEKAKLERERNRQEAILEIRNRYGKNSILRGMNFEEGATAKDRNRQIGGHKA
mgnify:CR=1 FL=1